MQALTVSAQSLCSSRRMSAQSMNHKQRCGLQTWDGQAEASCQQARRTKHQHCRDTDDDGRDRVHQAVQEYGQSLPREASKSGEDTLLATTTVP
jgi:hypothetical protein